MKLIFNILLIKSLQHKKYYKLIRAAFCGFFVFNVTMRQILLINEDPLNNLDFLFM